MAGPGSVVLLALLHICRQRKHKLGSTSGFDKVKRRVRNLRMEARKWSQRTTDLGTRRADKDVRKAVRRVKRWLRTKRLQALQRGLVESQFPASRGVEGGRLWATGVQKMLLNFWAVECFCAPGVRCYGRVVRDTFTIMRGHRAGKCQISLYMKDSMTASHYVPSEVHTQSPNQTWLCPNKVAASHMLGPLASRKAVNPSDQQWL